MKTEVRLNTVYAGITLAALGVLCAWEESKEIAGRLLAADTERHASFSFASAHNMTLLVSCATLFVTGVGLALFAALRDGRLK